MKIKCLYDSLVDISKLKPHPKNRNKHPAEQIERLAKILEYQGWRYPVKVSKLSGCVTSGHGRIEAARVNGWKKVPVNYQAYESEDQEYADVQADNTIASWAELDLAAVNKDLAELNGQDFDLKMLGMRNFELEVSEKLLGNGEHYGDDYKGQKLLEYLDKEVCRILLTFEQKEYEAVVKWLLKLQSKHSVEDFAAALVLEAKGGNKG